MERKRAYLMAKARQLPVLVELGGCYDEQEKVNVQHLGGLRTPLAVNARITHTASKTFAAPGDDDPDPDDERFY